jgi:hypothetical protein
MSNKQTAAAKTKVVEDKTFGLKNKNKSKKVQNYVREVTKAADQTFTDKKKQKELDDAKAKKEARKKNKEEMAELFKVAIIQPKVPFGVDPKTIACAFFKAGQCKKKGDACKFSHDQEICFGRKKAVNNAIDLTCDVKSKKKEEEGPPITDPEELKKAIEKKAAQMKCETHIICKHFLAAIEKKQYGWFWQCPDNMNGNECKYRHALPEGYVFKKDAKKGEDEDDDGTTLEERLDEMRRGMGAGSMLVTKDTFTAWKEAREAKKAEEMAKSEAAAQKTYKRGGKTTLTGRQLFEFDASIFVDDIDASGGDTYQKEFEDAADMETAKTGGVVAAKPAAEEPAMLLPEEVAAAEMAAAVEALPEGIEENLFLDEDLDDLPSDED